MNKPHEHQHGHQSHHKPKNSLHKDWRLWTVVVLMLIAMAIYVTSFDEQITPQGNIPAEKMPAAAP